MKMYDKAFDSEKERWWKLCLLVDAVAKVDEEGRRHRRRRAAEVREEYKYLKTLCEEKRENGFFHNIPRKLRSSLVERRDTQQTLNRVSTSSSSSLNLFPQNPSPEPMVYDEEQRSKKGKAKMVCEDGDDEVSERRLFEKNMKRFVTSSRRYTQGNYENRDGASTSSSFLKLRCFESSLHIHDSEKTEMKDPPNLNYQSSSPSSCITENTNRKRRAVSQKKSSGKVKKAKVAPLPPRVTETPEWLFGVMREMNSDDVIPTLIFARKLTSSDVNSGQSRLLIPCQQVFRHDFLTRAEIRAIKNEEEEEEEDENNTGVGTLLVNRWSEMWGLRFTIWTMEKKSGKGTSYYVLNWGWNDVVRDNDLRDSDNISLWTFRTNLEALITGIVYELLHLSGASTWK